LHEDNYCEWVDAEWGAREVRKFLPMSVCPHCFSTSQARRLHFEKGTSTCPLCSICVQCNWLEDVVFDPQFCFVPFWHVEEGWMEDVWSSLRCIGITQRYTDTTPYDSDYYLSVLQKIKACLQMWDGQSIPNDIQQECITFPPIEKPIKDVFSLCSTHSQDLRPERLKDIACSFVDASRAYLDAEIVYMTAATESIHFAHGSREVTYDTQGRVVYQGQMCICRFCGCMKHPRELVDGHTLDEKTCCLECAFPPCSLCKKKAWCYHDAVKKFAQRHGRTHDDPHFKDAWIQSLQFRASPCCDDCTHRRCAGPKCKWCDEKQPENFVKTLKFTYWSLCRKCQRVQCSKCQHEMVLGVDVDTPKNKTKPHDFHCGCKECRSCGDHKAWTKEFFAARPDRTLSDRCMHCLTRRCDGFP